MTKYKALSELKAGDTLYVTDGLEPVHEIHVTEVRTVPCIHGGRQDGENLVIAFDNDVHKTIMLSSSYARRKKAGADFRSSVNLPGAGRNAYTTMEEARQRIMEKYEEQTAPLHARIEECRRRIELLTARRDHLHRDILQDRTPTASGTMYITVRIDYEYPEGTDEDKICLDIISGSDLSFSPREGQPFRITNTEICRETI